MLFCALFIPLSASYFRVQLTKILVLGEALILGVTVVSDRRLIVGPRESLGHKSLGQDAPCYSWKSQYHSSRNHECK